MPQQTSGAPIAPPADGRNGARMSLGGVTYADACGMQEGRTYVARRCECEHEVRRMLTYADAC
jgi:hypothetical protein